MKKRCSRCRRKRDVSFFSKNKNNPDELQIWCRDCYNAYSRSYYHSRPKESRELSEKQFAKFYVTLNGRATHMLNNLRGRARRNGRPFDVTHEWILEKLRIGVCEVTGIKFIFSERNGRGHRLNSFSPSIDRIDQDGPYTTKNCRMTVWIYNRARGAFPDRDFDVMIRALILKAKAGRKR